jgi:integrase/recombinase XerD
MLPNCLNDFLGFTAKRVQNIITQDIKNYHKHLQERPNKRRAGGLSESYIHHHIYSLKLFFAWQEEKGIVTQNPISCLTFKTPVSKQREILTKEEVLTLYKSCETLKEKAILSVFYGCGLRRSEGEQLDLKDVHFRSGILYVRKGKNSKRRAVPMSEKVNQDLKNYVYKERFTSENTTAFFSNHLGTRMQGLTHSRALKKLLESSKVTKDISLHCLRHSIATHLLESGLSVEYVRDFLGHKHLESTQIYTRISTAQLWNLKTT